MGSKRLDWYRTDFVTFGICFYSDCVNIYLFRWCIDFRFRK